MCGCCWKNRRKIPETLDYLEGKGNEEELSEVSHLIARGDGYKRTSSHRLSEQDQLQLPSYWTSQFVQSGEKEALDGEVEVQFTPQELSSFYLVDVTEEFKDELEGLIELLGGMSELVKVHRVENQDLWINYSQYRASILQKHEDEEIAETTLHPLSMSNWMFKEFELERRVNEVLVLHGTTGKVAPVVCHQGFEARIVKKLGKSGRGIYFSDEIGKADQYADNDIYGLRHVFLSRVTLGVPYVTDSHLRQQMSAPSIEGQQYDSVAAKREKYNEFVVYDAQQCYPELILTYFSGKKYCGICE